MRTVEEILLEQFVVLKSKFRPVYGNPDHINLLKILSELEKIKDDPKKKNDAHRLRRMAVYLLKK